jgi:hypothetical protein
VHHLEEIDLIWRKEKASWKRITWVFFVRSLTSFFVYFGGDYPDILFPGAWHKLDEREAHCRKRLSLFIGPDIHRLT